MMPKKYTIVFVLMIFALLSLASCMSQPIMQTQDLSNPSDYSDFIGVAARIGSEEGDVYAQVARDIFSAAGTPEYRTIYDALDALLTGEIDAVLASGGFVRQLLASDRGKDFEYLAVPPDLFINEAGPIFHSTELRDEYNAWYAEAAQDGIWDEVTSRWLHGSLPQGADIPRFEFTGEAGTIRVADTGTHPPLSYVDEEGEIIGFDIEIVSRFALSRGMAVELVQLPYAEIIDSVRSGRVDMSACTYSIHERRDVELIFGEPSVFTQAVLIIPSADARKSMRENSFFLPALPLASARAEVK